MFVKLKRKNILLGVDFGTGGCKITVIDDNGNDTNGYGGGVVSIDDILNWGSDQEGIEDGAWDNGFDPIQ